MDHEPEVPLSIFFCAVVFDGLTFEEFIRTLTSTEKDYSPNPATLDLIFAKIQPKIEHVFKALQTKTPHESYLSIWDQVQKTLAENVPENIFQDLGQFLLHGSRVSFPTAPQQNSSPSYPYIDLKEDEFRLIVLHPATDLAAPVECQICHERLRPGVPYEALSYVWGDASVLCAIRLSGREFLATRNLDDALKALRFRSKPRVLWVDAICINQRNNTEKSSQIQKMAEIYSLATEVLVWIGKQTNSSIRALTLLQVIINPYQETPTGPYVSILDARSIYECPGLCANHTFKKYPRWWHHWGLYFQNTTRPVLEFLKTFFQRPWWTRIWVFQEVVLATSATIVCGDTAMPWKDFHGAMRATSGLCMLEAESIFRRQNLGNSWGQRLALLEDIKELSKPVETMQFYRSKIEEGTAIDLQDVIQATVDFKSTDPRDKIYALLGLIKSNLNIFEQIPVDYTATTDVVYRRVAKYLVEQCVDTVVGHHNTNSCFKNGVLCLESWVADFRGLIRVLATERDSNMALVSSDDARPGSGGATSPIFACTDGEDPQYKGGLRLKTLDPFPVVFSEDLRILTVTGVVIDRITTIAPGYSAGRADVLKNLESWERALLDCVSLDDVASVCAGNDEEEARFWQAILASRTVADAKAKDAGIEASIAHATSLGLYPSDIPEKELQLRKHLVNQVKARAMTCARFRVMFSASGILGECPQTVLEGDLVIFLSGAVAPICIRRIGGNGDGWRIVGNCNLIKDAAADIVDALQKGKGGYNIQRFRFC